MIKLSIADIALIQVKNLSSDHCRVDSSSPDIPVHSHRPLIPSKLPAEPPKARLTAGWSFRPRLSSLLPDMLG